MPKKPYRPLNEWAREDQIKLLERLTEIVEEELKQTQRKKNLIRFINRTARSYKY